MSRSNNRRKARRDNYPIANPRLPRFSIDPVPYLSQYEDRRTFHPDSNYRPIRSFNGYTTVLTDNLPRKVITSQRRSVSRSQSRDLRQYSTFRDVSSRGTFRFDQPSKVLACVRRRIREEVLHAFRKTGRTGQSRPRYNELSRIRCK